MHAEAVNDRPVIEFERKLSLPAVHAESALLTTTVVCPPTNSTLMYDGATSDDDDCTLIWVPVLVYDGPLAWKTMLWRDEDRSVLLDTDTSTSDCE